MTDRSTRYWCFRIDTYHSEFIGKELKDGRLRQGWGWDGGQDLRFLRDDDERWVDEGARRNQRMFLEVKKGDRILVPRLPEWSMVTIVEATEDWDRGYSYEPAEETGDHGHVFPVKHLRSFARNSGFVDGSIRSTLRNPQRFWEVTWYADSIESILATDEEIGTDVSPTERFEEVVRKSFESIHSTFVQEVSAQTRQYLESKDWEAAYRCMIECLFPYCQAEVVQGKLESEHGTDVLVTVPGPFGNYGIAVQVKDWQGEADRDEIVEQMKNADGYWKKDRDFLHLSRVALLVGVYQRDNPDWQREYGDVTFLFREDLDRFLGRYAVKSAGGFAGSVDDSDFS